MTLHPEELVDKYEDRERTDSSRYLRAHIRSLFLKGQQLWDSFFNNDLQWWQYWVPRKATWRRNYPHGPANFPPWYSPNQTEYVRDRWDTAANDEEENRVYFYARGMLEPIQSMPHIGCTCYVMADRMVVIFNGSEAWVPFFRLPQYDKNFELAVFADHPKANQPVFSHTVSQPFKLFSGNTDCRLAGWAYNLPPLPIHKNGVQVGTVFQTRYSSGAAFPADVEFEAGDVIQVIHPNVSARPWLAITLVGGFL